MAESRKKTKCADCDSCQSCGKNRCRICRLGCRRGEAWELGRGFTYGDYLEWKSRQSCGKDSLH